MGMVILTMVAKGGMGIRPMGVIRGNTMMRRWSTNCRLLASKRMGESLSEAFLMHSSFEFLSSGLSLPYIV